MRERMNERTNTHTRKQANNTRLNSRRSRAPDAASVGEVPPADCVCGVDAGANIPDEPAPVAHKQESDREARNEKAAVNGAQRHPTRWHVRAAAGLSSDARAECGLE